MREQRRGFTLVEILVVLAILAIIMSIAIANLKNAAQRARQKRSMADMRTIALGMEAYATDHNRYPSAAAFSLPSGLSLPGTFVSGLQTPLAPTYIKKVPLMDGWNGPFTFSVNTGSTDYGVRSYGGDGQPDSSPSYGPTTSYNADIILVDGLFVQYPDGVQR